MEIKSIAVFKSARIVALTCAAMAAAWMWLIVAVVWLGPIPSLPGSQHRPAPPLLPFALAPIFYGVFIFLIVALMCWLYNVFTPWIGGVELVVSESKQEPG